MATNQNAQNFYDNELSEEENNDSENIKIMSVSFQKGQLACCYYKSLTMELFVTHEAPDTPPGFPFLLNLLRYVKPSHLIASGPVLFLKCAAENFGLSASEIDLDNLRFNKKQKNGQTLPISNFIVYPFDEKTIQQNYHKIIQLHLPGMERLICNDNVKITDEERRIFISSILPLHQTQVVLCLGNLLHYINHKWKYYALNHDGNLKVTDLKIFFLQSQLLISDSTLASFQIFKSLHHPSGFMKGLNANSKEGYSIYMFLNKCQSRIGSKALHSLLLQPVRDIHQLELSFSTIDWYIKEQKSGEKWSILKRHLKNIRDVSQTFRNIILKPNNMKNWKILKETTYNAYLIMKFCQSCVQINTNRNCIEQLANTLAEEDKQVLQNILYTLNAVADLEQGCTQGRFIVKDGFDTDLDEKKSKMISIQDELQSIVRNQIEMMPELLLENILGYYIPEVGYVIRVEKNYENQGDNHNLIENLINSNLSLLIESEDSYYLTSSICDDLNQKYGDIYPEICEHESRICDRLIKYLKENISAVIEVVKICIKLDYMMSFASIAIERCFTKPQIIHMSNQNESSNNKLIEIQQGRHILWEIKENSYISNDTIISKENHNLITILMAPNSSGKSVYMKQIGTIAYLAHTGCFVPAKYTKLSLLDAIHTQMYTTESIHEATSSFLSDLLQLSHIMNTTASTKGQSLVLIDEFGKGTTDIEGQALLVACIEEFLNRGDDNCPITIISTHYTDIMNLLKSKENVRVQTFECANNERGEIHSTFKLQEPENNTNNFKLPSIMVDSIKQSLMNILQPDENTTENADGDQIYFRKISYAYEILKYYSKSRQIDYDEVVKDFQEIEF